MRRYLRLGAVLLTLALLAIDAGGVLPFQWWQIDGTQSARLFYPRDDTSTIGHADSTWPEAWIRVINVDTLLVARLEADTVIVDTLDVRSMTADAATIALLRATIAYLDTVVGDSISMRVGQYDSVLATLVRATSIYGHLFGKADSSTYADTSAYCDTCRTAGSASAADTVLCTEFIELTIDTLTTDYLRGNSADRITVEDSTHFANDVTIATDLDVDGLTEVDSLHASLGITVDGGAVIDDSTHVDNDLTADVAGIGEAADADVLSVGGTTDTDSLYVSGGARVAGKLHSEVCETFAWLEPDVVDAIANGTALTFRHFPAEQFASGITILMLEVDASAAVSDTLVVQEWSDAVGTSKSAVDTLILSTANRAEITTGFDDASIAADAHLALLFSTQQDDIALLKLTIRYEAQ